MRRRYREGDIRDYGNAAMPVYVSGGEPLGGESGIPVVSDGVLMLGALGADVRVTGTGGCVVYVS